MTYLLLLAVAALGGGVAALWLLAQRNDARAEANAWRLTAGQRGEDIKDLRLRIENDSRRLGAVITQYRAEIMRLEKDVNACADPVSVRDRLRRLLQDVPERPTLAASRQLDPTLSFPPGDPRGTRRG